MTHAMNTGSSDASTTWRAWLEALQIKQNITLVMHDWGGAIAMGYAARHRERVSRLVVMNTAAFPMPGTKMLPWSLWFCPEHPTRRLVRSRTQWLCSGAG